MINAIDLGRNPLTSLEPASVTVNVDRNLNSPRFTENSYEVGIDRNLASNSMLISVNAVDEDTSVSLPL